MRNIDVLYVIESDNIKPLRHRDLDKKRKVAIDRVDSTLMVSSIGSCIGRALVNLATHMPPKSGVYTILYVRLSDSLTLDSPVTVMA